MKKVYGIVGSRNHPNPEMVREFVQTLRGDAVVISGGAEGVDSVAADEARQCGLRVVEYGPDSVLTLAHVVATRDRLLLRNTVIVAVCDELVVFPDGSKGGTWDTVREAKRFRRPYTIKYADGREVEG